MDIAGRIKGLLEEKKWSKYKLAQKCEVSQPVLTNILRGKTKPTINAVNSIAQAFGMTLYDFFAVDVTELHPSEQERRYLHYWSCLTPSQREEVMSALRNML